MHWKKFSDALEDLRLATPEPKYRSTFSIAISLLGAAERFYYPEGQNVLEGTRLDAPVQMLIRLPFDAIAVLSEVGFEDEPGRRISDSWTISVAMTIDSDLNRALRICDPEKFTDCRFIMLAIDYSPQFKRWLLNPLPAVLSIKDGSDGWTYSFADVGVHTASIVDQYSSVLRSKGFERGMMHDLSPNFTTITNLCAMLGTRVAKSTAIPVPTNLAKSRKMRGKKPLPDYHVLEVGADRWDGVSRGSSDVSVRSHLRRGHIRQFAPGKFTWVRNTIVQGGSSGFVSKDYLIRPEKGGGK